MWSGYAAIADSVSAAWQTGSASAGGTPPMGPRRRRLSNQATHSGVAYSMVSQESAKARRWMTSALQRRLVVWAKTLSQLSPTRLTDG